jgi:hypothetical protein
MAAERPRRRALIGLSRLLNGGKYTTGGQNTTGSDITGGAHQKRIVSPREKRRRSVCEETRPLLSMIMSPFSSRMALPCG